MGPMPSTLNLCQVMGVGESDEDARFAKVLAAYQFVLTDKQSGAVWEDKKKAKFGWKCMLLLLVIVRWYLHDRNCGTSSALRKSGLRWSITSIHTDQAVIQIITMFGYTFNRALKQSPGLPCSMCSLWHPTHLTRSRLLYQSFRKGLLKWFPIESASDFLHT